MNTSRASGRRNVGEELEWRVGRLYFWSGQFSRTGIDLREHFHPAPLTVTDLDLLAFDISHLLTVEKTIGESKGGAGKSAPKPLDRTFWLSGLRAYTGADAAVLSVATKVSREVRLVADRLGVSILTVDELTRLEAAAGLDKHDYGSYAWELRGLWRDIRATARQDNALERACRFLRADMWHLDAWLALKRSMAMLDLVSKRWVENLSTAEVRLLQALLVEGVVVFTLAAVRVTGELRWLPEDQVAETLTERLGEGLAPTGQLVRLSDAVDRYVLQLLDEVKAPQSKKVQALGAFRPRPPDWADAFREVAQRLGNEAPVASDLPRAMDVLLYDNVVRGEATSRQAIDALRLVDVEDTLRLTRLIAVFLGAHAGIPRFLFDALGMGIKQNRAPQRRPSEDGVNQPTLLRNVVDDESAEKDEPRG